jgi:hypothetical protein
MPRRGGEAVLDKDREACMEALVFVGTWLVGAALHTLFDLKVRPVLRALREESDQL